MQFYMSITYVQDLKGIMSMQKFTEKCVMPLCLDRTGHYILPCYHAQVLGYIISPPYLLPIRLNRMYYDEHQVCAQLAEQPVVRRS